MYIQGIGERTVEDSGGAINGDHIDLFISDLQQAVSFGKQEREVWIVKRGEGN